MIVEEPSQDIDPLLTEEVCVMRKMITTAGYTVEVVTASNQPIGTAAANLALSAGWPPHDPETILVPDLKPADVNPGDYAGVILPCMTPQTVSHHPAAVAIVRQSVALGIPVAAEASGTRLLGRAGVLGGRQFAMKPGGEWTVPNGIYKGAGVVQDGNIITSGSCAYSATAANMPEGTHELMQRFIAALAMGR